MSRDETLNKMANDFGITKKELDEMEAALIEDVQTLKDAIEGETAEQKLHYLAAFFSAYNGLLSHEIGAEKTRDVRRKTITVLQLLGFR